MDRTITRNILIVATILALVILSGCSVARTRINGEAGPIAMLDGAAGASPTASFNSGVDVVAGSPDPFSVTVDSDGLATTATGPVRSVGFTIDPVTKEVRFALASTSDLTLDGASLGSDEHGNPVVTLSGLSSGQSSMAQARTELYTRLVTSWTTLSADQRAVFVEAIQGGATIAEALAEVGITIATGGAGAVIP